MHNIFSPKQHHQYIHRSDMLHYFKLLSFFRFEMFGYGRSWIRKKEKNESNRRPKERRGGGEEGGVPTDITKLRGVVVFSSPSCISSFYSSKVKTNTAINCKTSRPVLTSIGRAWWWQDDLGPAVMQSPSQPGMHSHEWMATSKESFSLFWNETKRIPPFHTLQNNMELHPILSQLTDWTNDKETKLKTQST